MVEPGNGQELKSVNPQFQTLTKGLGVSLKRRRIRMFIARHTHLNFMSLCKQARTVCYHNDFMPMVTI